MLAAGRRVTPIRCLSRRPGRSGPGGACPKEPAMGVTVESDGSVATVTLRWPEQRNALGPDEARDVTAALTSTVAAGGRGGVVAGEGAFCAGGNLRGMVARAEMPAEERRRLVY